MFNPKSSTSIVRYAKKLKNQSLREACEEEIEKHGYKGKGNFGQILEKFYFGYSPNSNSEPDFPEAGIELKTSPLKALKNGTFNSKERLVMNIINYLEVHKESFETSSFWKKNSHLLLVFYLHEPQSDLLDYVIRLVDEWKFPPQDLKIIKDDWHKINQKIVDGKAHELSEGDTFYLGACTKGSTALKSLRDQPFNNEKAKQRAYSLKQGYVNHIIASISKNEKEIYGKIIKNPKEFEKYESFEEFVISKFKPFYGKTRAEIEAIIGKNPNKQAKNYYANLTQAVFGIELKAQIDEFEKANIKTRTVRLKKNDVPKESISFKQFKYEKLVGMNWEDSEFKEELEKKFFFVFYRMEGKQLFLEKVKFWNMPQSDINIAKEVWKKTKKLVQNGTIVEKKLANGNNQTYFPNKSENKVSHVRPKARNKFDTYPLPVTDKFTGSNEYMKHCFWLNAEYIRDEIYRKN